ncbi:glycoside hydrolase family 35 protein [Apiospora arundinis]
MGVNIVVQYLATLGVWGVWTPVVLGAFGLFIWRVWVPVRDWLLHWRPVRVFCAATKVLSEEAINKADKKAKKEAKKERRKKKKEEKKKKEKEEEDRLEGLRLHRDTRFSSPRDAARAWATGQVSGFPAPGAAPAGLSAVSPPPPAPAPPPPPQFPLPFFLGSPPAPRPLLLLFLRLPPRAVSF